jgi:hypothetical protein
LLALTDFVAPAPEKNAVKVYAAVQAYAPGRISEQAIDFLAQPKKILRISNGDLIEILTSTKSTEVSFDDLWRDRCEVSVSVVVGDPPKKYKFGAPFVSKAHLLQLKKEAVSDPGRDENKREQDQKDVESLQ